MRDFFESNTGRYGTAGIIGALAAGGLSLAGGAMAASAQKKAQQRAQEQAGRDISNVIQATDIDRQIAEAAARRRRFDPGSALNLGGVTAEGGFRTAEGEFLTGAQARERGLVRDIDRNIRQEIRQRGENQIINRQVQDIFVDPSLQSATRTRLAPELEAMRTQALDFQRAAGADLTGGGAAATQRELDLLNQLAGPREAEAREQIFGQLQRAGLLQSTGGATFARGAEEALQRAGLERELAAIRSGREGQRLASDIFQLGSSTVGGLAGLEQQAAAQRLAERGAAEGQVPFIPTPTNVFGRAPVPEASPFDVGVGAALQTFGQQVGQMDFGNIFNLGGRRTGQAVPTGETPNRSEVLFGTFAR